MKIFDFKQKLIPMGAFSLTDISMFYPDFDRRRLSEWIEKGYIVKIRREWYCFSDYEKSEFFSFFVANKIYSPSYISLESAMSYHGIIPEAVYSISSVTTNKTKTFDTPLGCMLYKTIRPGLFFGYRLIYDKSRPVKIAGPEKAILDFFYLNSQYKTEDDFAEIRLSLENVSLSKLRQLLKRYESPTLEIRIKKMLEVHDVI